jgi:hypothetical protein
MPEQIGAFVPKHDATRVTRTYDLMGQYDAARTAAVAEWAAGNRAAYVQLCQDVDREYAGFGKSSTITAMAERDIRVKAGELAGFPSFDVWKQTPGDQT